MDVLIKQRRILYITNCMSPFHLQQEQINGNTSQKEMNQSDKKDSPTLKQYTNTVQLE